MHKLFGSLHCCFILSPSLIFPLCLCWSVVHSICTPKSNTQFNTSSKWWINALKCIKNTFSHIPASCCLSIRCAASILVLFLVNFTESACSSLLHSINGRINIDRFEDEWFPTFDLFRKTVSHYLNVPIYWKALN